MSNAVKYSAVAVPHTIKCGNIVIGNENVDYGPTSSTGFYSGIDPPDSGYTIYFVDESNKINARCTSNDNELLLIGKEYGGSSIQTITDAITYFATGSTGTTIVNTNYPPIITDGLVLYCDAQIVLSYPKLGNIWKDISSNKKTGIFTTGYTFNQKYFNFNGFDQVAYGYSQILSNTTTGCTLEIIANIYQSAYYGILFYVGNSSYNHNQPYIMLGTLTSPDRFIFSTNKTSGGSRLVHLVSTSLTSYQNRWCHYVGTMGNGILTLYINGEYVSEYTLPENYYTELYNENTYIGGSTYSASHLSETNCGVGECRIYNKPLQFSEIQQNYAASISKYYIEMISNGNFETATGWTLTDGVTISGGTLNFLPSTSVFVYNTSGETMEIGKNYYIVFTILEIVGGIGYIKAACGGWGIGSEFTTTGTKSQIITITNASGVFSFYGSLNVKIDNVSVKEIL